MQVKSLAAIVLSLSLAATPAVAAAGPLQAAATRAVQQMAADEAGLWRTMLAGLEPGVLVAVRLKDGTRVSGTVLGVGADTFTFKERTRIPVPARDLAFADIATVERQKPPMSPGKKVLIGVGVGGAVYLVGAAILLAAIGYD